MDGCRYGMDGWMDGGSCKYPPYFQPRLSNLCMYNCCGLKSKLYHIWYGVVYYGMHTNEDKRVGLMDGDSV